MNTADIEKTLAMLCAADGVSGAEDGISRLLSECLADRGDTDLDAKGNVIFRLGGSDESKKTLLLCAHIDEIGFVVNYITDDGFLKVSPCGGIDRRVLPASRVTVLADGGENRIKGVFTSVPPHLQSKTHSPAPIDELFVDIGLDGTHSKKAVKLGDRALIEAPLMRIGSLVSSKALDNRICAAALLETADLLKGKQTAYNVVLLFSVGEEVGSVGAKTAGYSIGADISIAVDVTFGKSHSESEKETGALGSGAMIGISPVLSRTLSQTLINIARAEKIPYGIEIMPQRTGTDADALSVVKGGSIAATVSLPIRYMHTPVETADISDIENTAKLLAAFAERGGV